MTCWTFLLFFFLLPLNYRPDWTAKDGHYDVISGVIAGFGYKKSTLTFYRAMLCIRGTSHGPVSVCPSVTSRSSTKMAKHRITQTTPRDIPGTLVFWSQRSSRNSTDRGHPLQGRQMQVGWVKIGDFRQITGYISKRYKIDAWFLLKSNRKLYALHRMVALPIILSDP